MAYATTCKGGIMKDLHEMGLEGESLVFIENFLMGRKFKVCLDNAHSSLNLQEEGVPQSSIIPPTIVDTLPEGIDKSLYVADLAVYCPAIWQ